MGQHSETGERDRALAAYLATRWRSVAEAVRGSSALTDYDRTAASVWAVARAGNTSRASALSADLHARPEADAEYAESAGYWIMRLRALLDEATRVAGGEAARLAVVRTACRNLATSVGFNDGVSVAMDQLEQGEQQDMALRLDEVSEVDWTRLEMSARESPTARALEGHYPAWLATIRHP